MYVSLEMLQELVHQRERNASWVITWIRVQIIAQAISTQFLVSSPDPPSRAEKSGKNWGEEQRKEGLYRRNWI